MTGEDPGGATHAPTGARYTEPASWCRRPPPRGDPGCTVGVGGETVFPDESSLHQLPTGHHSPWAPLCMGPSVPGPHSAWAPQCLGPSVHGPLSAWAPQFLGPSVHGPHCAWALLPAAGRAWTVNWGTHRPPLLPAGVVLGCGHWRWALCVRSPGGPSGHSRSPRPVPSPSPARRPRLVTL